MAESGLLIASVARDERRSSSLPLNALLIRGAWRESGSSGFFGLSRLFGSTNERDKTDPRTSQPRRAGQQPRSDSRPLARSI